MIGAVLARNEKLWQPRQRTTLSKQLTPSRARTMPSCYKFLDFLDGSDVLIGWLHDPVDRALDGTSPGRLPHCTTFFFKVHVARPWLRSRSADTPYALDAGRNFFCRSSFSMFQHVQNESTTAHIAMDRAKSMQSRFGSVTDLQAR